MKGKEDATSVSCVHTERGREGPESGEGVFSQTV